MRRSLLGAAALLALTTLACADRSEDSGTLAPRPGGDDAQTLLPWPGPDDVRTVDERGTFGGNISGLVYDLDDRTAPVVLWAVRNYPGTLFRLMFRDGLWRPDTAAGWGAGRRLHFASGRGDVDAEGLALVGVGRERGAYVASERDNDVDDVSRNTIMRFDPALLDAALRPTHTWDITADLPVVLPNKGIEAIAFIPDAHLVAAGFRDARTGAAYDPARYAEHGGGLFAVGLEADGAIYLYALDHRTETATRIAVVTTGLASVMALEYDADTRELWAHCDDVCDNEARVFVMDPAGQLTLARRFAPPTSLPNANHEGLTIAPRRACVDGRRPILWADDSETGGNALRGSTLPCPAGR
jgi:hypothetical protein